MAKPTPPQAVINRWLRYEPASGKLFWKHPVYNFRCKAGHEALASVNQDGYRRGGFQGSLHMAHRIIWKLAHGYDAVEIDHIDGNKQNNRIENLRSVDRITNTRNGSAQKNSTSGVKGVSRIGKRWRATIRDGGKQVQIGSYISPVEAMTARHLAAIKLGYIDRA